MAEHKQLSSVDSATLDSKVEPTEKRESKIYTSSGHNETLPENPNLPYIEWRFDNRDKWLEWRGQGIGGSEVSACLNKSPFLSRLELLKQKLGMAKKKEPNVFMERGIMLEETVRQMCEARLKESLPSKILQSKEWPDLVCQIDGLGKKHQVEIKCAATENSFSAMGENIPLHYQYQMQHQMVVTSRKTSVFACYFEGRLRLFQYDANPEMQEEVIYAVLQFQEDLQKAREANEKQNKDPEPR